METNKLVKPLKFLKKVVLFLFLKNLIVLQLNLYVLSSVGMSGSDTREGEFSTVIKY